MSVTPVNYAPARIYPIFSPYSGWVTTPGSTAWSKDKRSRKLLAGINESELDEGTYDYTGILKKTWRLYSMSPLYNFKVNQLAFKKYARSLDAAFTEKKNSYLISDEGPESSSFSVYQGLKFSANDPEAIHIQVRESKNEKVASSRHATSMVNETQSQMKESQLHYRSYLVTVANHGSSIVLNALMVCVDLDERPVPDSMKAKFSYYPVLMISGNKHRSNILLEWLERHFDCSTSCLTLSNNDLQWMLACWSTVDAGFRAPPILLQYSLEDVCEGISTINCTFEASFCQQLWQRIKKSDRCLDQDEMATFIEALETHLEYTMHIVFSKLQLSEVGTSIAYVSREGKLKLFQSDNVYLPLYLLCAVSNDRFCAARPNML